MRAVYPAWDHLGPEPTLRRSFSVALVAAAIGAIAGAAVKLYLASYPRRGADGLLASPRAIVIEGPAVNAGSAVPQTGQRQNKSQQQFQLTIYLSQPNRFRPPTLCVKDLQISSSSNG